MAALTWRNVDAPDFTPSMRGYETFSRLLDNAFGSAERGLARYDQSLDRSANNRILMQFAGLQDPEAAKAALAALAADPQAARINAQTIDAVTGRPDALIRQAMNQENLGWTNYQHNRTRGFDTAEDAAAPLVADRLAAYAQGKGAEWEAAHPDAFKGLSMAARTTMFDQGQRARMGDLDITGKDLSNQGARIQNKTSEFNLETGQWRFGNEKLDRARSEQVSGYLARYASSGGNLDPNYLDSDPNFTKLDPTVQMTIRSQLGGIGMGGGSSVGPIPQGGGAPGGGDPTRIMNYQARDAGFLAVPDSVKTLGGASDFAIQVNNAGVPSSAMGLYQIVGQTMRGYAPKVFGNNWRNVEFNAANQDKLAEAIFNDNKGSAQALRSQWVSLSPQMAEQIRRMPWSQARQYIASGESGGNPAALLIGATVAGQGARNQYMQGNANSIAEPIQAALADTSSLVDVASGLVGDKGALKGADRGWVMQQIQRIQAMGNGGRNPVQISPAAAAVILQRSVTSTSGNWLPDRFNTDAVGGGLQVNRDSAKSFVDSIRTGDYQRQVVTNTGIAQRGAQIEAAKAQWDAARARLTAAQQRAAQNPNFDRSVLGRLAIAETAAAEQYRAAIGQQGGAASAAGGFGATAAPPPPARPRPVAVARPAVRPSASTARPNWPVDTAPGWFARDQQRGYPFLGATGPTRGPTLLEQYSRR